MHHHRPRLYYMCFESLWEEVFRRGRFFDLQVAYPGATEGCEVGAGSQGVGEVHDEGTDVGATTARDVEGGSVPIEGQELEGMYRRGAALALDLFAAAQCFVEAFSFHLDGGGHRGNLAYLARKLLCRGAYGGFVRYRNVFEGCDPAVRVQGVGDGAEARGGDVLLVEAGHVAGETGRSAPKENQKPGGEGVEGAGVPDLDPLRQEALYPGDCPGAGDAGRLVQQQRAGEARRSYVRRPSSRRGLRRPSRPRAVPPWPAVAASPSCSQPRACARHRRIAGLRRPRPRARNAMTPLCRPRPPSGALRPRRRPRSAGGLWTPWSRTRWRRYTCSRSRPRPRPGPRRTARRSLEKRRRCSVSPRCWHGLSGCRSRLVLLLRGGGRRPARGLQGRRS